MKSPAIGISTLIPMLGLFLSSCEKFVDIDPPTNSFIAGTAFATDELVEANIAGMYSYNLIGSAYHDVYRHIYPAFSADELLHFNSPEYDQFVYNSLLPSNGSSLTMWRIPYHSIYQSNLMLSALAEAPNISENVRKEALGVARFFRALSYLNLVSLFGDVPLVLTADVTVSGSLARSPKLAVYAQIIDDLTQAKVLLRHVTKNNGWATEPVAAALLARAYLYQEQWEQAASEADQLINGPLKGSLALEEITQVFLRSSQETIFAISTDGSSRTTIGHTNAGRYYIPSPSARGASLFFTDDFLDAFEEGDQRRVNWVNQFTAREPFNWYPYKYKQRSTPDDGTLAENQVLIRLAEMYLIYAEANAQLGRLSAAINALNTIRGRAGLGELPPSLSKEEVLLAVEQERRVELFSEYGHRWVDLIRTGRADAVLGAHKGSSWKSDAVLYPIPEQDLELNRNLTQNPGY
ncbi:RagB/SusD family nutrient uptake outer membrane protein [Parapedobacter tibetensis]|uniref:RagB/SusD family nutrient uptake outer membrane protein n=1 Tax=Parapedobacter tibetensis TaxID=2972951 RepID=UPI00214D6B5B|nr:RagB/SusD family nutrient uptake outer membrane protein [Parapedobacter tibetensis]